MFQKRRAPLGTPVDTLKQSVGGSLAHVGKHWKAVKNRRKNIREAAGAALETRFKPLEDLNMLGQALQRWMSFSKIVANHGGKVGKRACNSWGTLKTLWKDCSTSWTAVGRTECEWENIRKAQPMILFARERHTNVGEMWAWLVSTKGTRWSSHSGDRY